VLISGPSLFLKTNRSDVGCARVPARALEQQAGTEEVHEASEDTKVLAKAYEAAQLSN
jgi:hypothetical protein